MAIFKGAAVAIVTPFFDNGEINYPKLAELLDYQIENGTDAIVICGTTGESSTLSHEEHLEMCIRDRLQCLRLPDYSRAYLPGLPFEMEP